MSGSWKLPLPAPATLVAKNQCLMRCFWCWISHWVLLIIYSSKASNWGSIWGIVVVEGSCGIWLWIQSLRLGFSTYFIEMYLRIQSLRLDFWSYRDFFRDSSLLDKLFVRLFYHVYERVLLSTRRTSNHYMVYAICIVTRFMLLMPRYALTYGKEVAKLRSRYNHKTV